MSSRRSVFAAAYATSGSKCPASMLKIRVHGLIDGGVAFVHVTPASCVTWMVPSSVPAQRTAIDFELGPSAVMLPIGPGFTVLAYLPAFAGTAHVCRVRSGEIRDHECPWSTLFHTTFDA